MSAADPPNLFRRVAASLQRDRELPIAHTVGKAARWVAQQALAPIFLAGCDHVGRGTRTRGRPVVINAGRIAIGARGIVNSLFAPVVLSSGPRGTLSVGTDSVLNFGSRLHAEASVTLGDHVSLGPYVTIDDTDDDGTGDDRGPLPIDVGDHVWLAAYARIRKGARIGRDTIIAAGSEVRGEIPEGVIAGGVPARVLRRRNPNVSAETEAADLPKFTPVRDPSTPLEIPRGRAHDVVRGAFDALSRWRLRGVDALGRGAHVDGDPYIENLGRIEIGDDFAMRTSGARSHLITGVGATLRIGHGVTIGPGAAISAMDGIDIGDGARIGESVMILDSDFHATDRHDARGLSGAITIGPGARLEDHVVVLKRARIGARAHVCAGSVVTGNVADDAYVSGVPAKARSVGRSS